MSIVGIFQRARPAIGGVYFDAVLEESSELQTDVSEFPIEDGSIGNDHATHRPLRLTMTVGVSDNPIRALAAQAGDLGGLAGVAIGAVGGAALGRLTGAAAALAGLGMTGAHAAFAAGQQSTRSASALEQIRSLQRSGAIVTVTSSKGTYENCIITNTRQATSKQNEQGLELIVELQQVQVINSTTSKLEIPAPNDTASTQAQRYFDLGELTPA